VSAALGSALGELGEQRRQEIFRFLFLFIVEIEIEVRNSDFWISLELIDQRLDDCRTKDGLATPWDSM
jgi:hypothetical protein